MAMFLTHTRFKRPVPPGHSKEQKLTLATGNEYIQSRGTSVIQTGWGKLVTLKKKNTDPGDELWIVVG